MTTAVRRRLATAASAAVLLCPCGAWAEAGPAAVAGPPVQVGWWNVASTSDVSAPSPTTPPGGLRVAALAGTVTAFGALELPAAPVRGTVVRLALARALGAAALQLCPTTSPWTGGDDQPFASAPTYDCTADAVTGTVDGTGQQVLFRFRGWSSGGTGVAVVPAGTGPGTDVDLAAPGPDSVVRPPAPPAPGTPASGAEEDADVPDRTIGSGTAAAPDRRAAPPALLPPTPAAVLPAGTSALAAGTDGTLPPAVAADVVGGQSDAVPPEEPVPTARAVVRPVAVAAQEGGGDRAGVLAGKAALLLLLLSWASGRGVLGSRVRPLAAPLTRPSGPGREPEPAREPSVL